MKKHKKILIIILSVVLLIVLFCPWPIVGRVEDGGTDMYQATLYEIVCWDCFYTGEDGKLGKYTVTRLYWFPDNFKSYDELFEIEKSRDDFQDYIVYPEGTS